MNPDIKKYLLAFELEKIQEHKNMAVFPILCNLDHSPKYITLKEALEKPRWHQRQGPCMTSINPRTRT